MPLRGLRSYDAMTPSATTRKPVGLALQGGGSWGAFTWGVLDALLSSRAIAVTQLSGASAGAINAAIVTGALAKGSPKLARQALRSFWMSMADDTVADAMRGFWLLACGILSSGQGNPCAADFLREAIAEHVDVDAIRGGTAPDLFVTVTNVKTGLPRVIANDAMSIDALLASACVPELFPPVELDGEWYWDGGYGGNPTLWPMIRGGAASDLIIVQLMRDRIEELPAGPLGIRRRVDEIVFNSSLFAEMQAIGTIRRLANAADVRLHRIGPPRGELFDRGSGIGRARAWIELLHEEGLAAGRLFMARQGAHIGIRETLDVARVYAGAEAGSGLRRAA